MQDYEAYLFTGVNRAVGCDCGTIEADSPPSLPYVAFEMLSNPVAVKYLDSAPRPSLYAPSFRVTAYVQGSDKEAAKALLASADDFLASVGLIRTFGPQRVTSSNSNILKMLSLYDGNLISTDGKTYTE